MRLRPFVVAAVLLSLPLHARAQVLVQGTDHVLIGRVHARTGGQVIPLARFGALLTGKGGSASAQMASAETGALSLVVSAASKKNSVAHVHWQLLPAADAKVPAAEGDVTVKEGGIAHATLSSGAGIEVSASFETGRAASFHPQRIVDVFGYPGAAAPTPVGFPSGAALTQEWRGSAPGSVTPPTAATPTGAAPQIAPMQAAPMVQPPPRPATTSLQVSCPSGSQWLLSTGNAAGRCAIEVDGTDRVTGGTCDDDAGNAARCSCTVNGGEGSCVSVRGLASCSPLRRP